MTFGIGYDEGFKCGERAGLMRAIAVMRNAVDGGHAEMRQALAMLESGQEMPRPADEHPRAEILNVIDTLETARDRLFAESVRSIVADRAHDDVDEAIIALKELVKTTEPVEARPRTSDPQEQDLEAQKRGDK